jgi:hypothetical protein
MERKYMVRLIALLSLLGISLSGFVQNDQGAFRPGQSVYAVALRSDSGGIDLAVESKVKKEFEKQKKFKVAASLTGADYVFLVLAEHDSYSAGVAGVSTAQNYLKSAFALVVSAGDYTEHKGNLEKLREVALWRGDSNAKMREASPAKLVQEFHKQIQK